LGAVKGNLVYDFYNQLLSEHGAALDWYATERLTLGAEYDYFMPTFDADSIFNWFSHSGATTVLGRAELLLSRRVDVAASGGMRFFRTEGDAGSYAAAQRDPNQSPDRSEKGTLGDLVSSLGGRYRFGDGSLGLRGRQKEASGHRVGGDLTGTKTFDGLRHAADPVIYDRWTSPTEPRRNQPELRWAAASSVRDHARSREHSMNRLQDSRFCRSPPSIFRCLGMRGSTTWLLTTCRVGGRACSWSDDACAEVAKRASERTSAGSHRWGDAEVSIADRRWRPRRRQGSDPIFLAALHPFQSRKTREGAGHQLHHLSRPGQDQQKEQ
jgi:hypothetical protein